MRPRLCLCANASMYEFAAAYAANPRPPRTLESDEVNRQKSRSNPANTSSKTNSPCAFALKCCATWSRVVSGMVENAWWPEMPAAWTTPFNTPNRSCVCSITACICDASPASALKITTSAPCASSASIRLILRLTSSCESRCRCHSDRGGNSWRPVKTNFAWTASARCSASTIPTPPSPPVMR